MSTATFPTVLEVTDLDAGADLAVEADRPIRAYVEDQGRAYVFFPSRQWRQLTGMPAARCTPARHLTQAQARALRVHNHECSKERKNAIVMLADAPDQYFTENEQEQILTWMAREAIR